MGICKRQALRRLIRRDQAIGGRLLKSMGEKRMPGRTQPSKYLVDLLAFHEVMRPDETTALGLETMRLELVVVRQQLGALRRAVAPLQRAVAYWNETLRDMNHT